MLRRAGWAVSLVFTTGLAIATAEGTAPEKPAFSEPTMVLVPAGEFVMGADDGDDDAQPAHPVFVEAFAIGAREVTNEEYALFVAETGRPAPGVRTLPEVVRASGREQAFRDSAVPYTWSGSNPPPDRLKHPVTLVTPDDAEAYCAWLAKKTGKPFRLPTEAEWEKAARGGVAGKRYPWGDDLGPADGNWLDDPKLRSERGTKPVASYAANRLGLWDVVGNAWEWVSDWYARYTPGRAKDPQGPAEGTQRMVRGGAWLDSDAAFLTVTHRHEIPPDTYSYSIGFRVAYSSP